MLLNSVEISIPAIVITSLFLPALITFVGVVLNVLEIEYAEVILTIAVAFNTFLGSILGISNINYLKGENENDL